MPSCCAFSCKNASSGKNKKEGVTFHGFPQDTKRASVWENKICRKNWKPSPHTKICSEHFEEDCFEEDLFHKYVGRGDGKKAIRRLKPDAVPTLNLTNAEEVNQNPRSHTVERIKKREQKQVCEAL